MPLCLIDHRYKCEEGLTDWWWSLYVAGRGGMCVCAGGEQGMNPPYWSSHQADSGQANCALPTVFYVLFALLLSLSAITFFFFFAYCCVLTAVAVTHRRP